MMLPGEPLVVERYTLKLAAPVPGVQLKTTSGVLFAVAVKPVGAVGAAAVGSADTCELTELSPTVFVPDTT
jgi:hypothetical protein